LTRTFIDTSAILALLVPTDEAHSRARAIFADLQAETAPLVTTSYVLVETYALLGRRLGVEAVRNFRMSFAPLLDVAWVDSDLHERALDLLLERPRGVSLVDAVSFVFLRDESIERAFVFDTHFEKEGVRTLR